MIKNALINIFIVLVLGTLTLWPFIILLCWEGMA